MASGKSSADEEMRLYEETMRLREMISQNSLSSKVSKYATHLSRKKRIKGTSRILSFLVTSYGKSKSPNTQDMENALKAHGYSITEMDRILYALSKRLDDPLSSFHKLAPHGAYTGWRHEGHYLKFIEFGKKEGRLVNVLGEKIYEISLADANIEVDGGSVLRYLYNQGNLGLFPHFYHAGPKGTLDEIEFYYLSKDALR